MTGAFTDRRHRRVLPMAGMLAVVALTTLFLGAPSAVAASYVPVSGAGSTWSQNAISQWASDVRQFGIVVNYQGTGSSDGRKQFSNSTVDFAVSEIPWGLKDNGVVDNPPTVRKYAYMPIVAGGTSFMYNLKIGGVKVTQLRLSGDNIAKIFTGGLAYWDDPAIKAENPNLALPHRKITPVVRSDGSGTTAQFSLWMSKKYASTWDAYCAKAGRSTPCGVTSNYPTVAGTTVAQAGSTGVAGYVSQAANEGTITYVEYSYALDANYPVVKLLNAGGYYVEPTAANVAVGLLGATINQDASSSAYLTQQLDGVYGNTDPRAYPLSSYSYMIIPTQAQAPVNENKGYTISEFAKYFLCEGQQKADDLGYSPLPINLVKEGLDQVKKIPGVQAETIDIAKCNNPTFSTDGTNTLAKNAKQPDPCAKAGTTTQCGFTTSGGTSPGTSSSASASKGTTTGGTTPSGTTPNGTNPGGTTPNGTTPNGTNPGGTTPNGTTPNGTNPGGTNQNGMVRDPDTGLMVPASGTGNGNGVGVDNATGQNPGGGFVNADGQTVAGGQIAGVPVSLSSDYTSTAGRTALMLFAVVLLVGVTIAPPLVTRYVTRRGPPA